MLGANVLSGPDEYSEIKGMGKSYLAFDWTNENILMKAQMTIDPSKLPPALRPMDAELSFEDIASQGVMIDVKESANTAGMDKKASVTVTICTRRPPKFFIPFEATPYPGEYRIGPKIKRRRSTAMDFAIGGKVCPPLFEINLMRS